VLRNSVGSAVMWSRRTEGGYGVIASATHTLGVGWFGSSETAVPLAFVEPESMGVLRLGVPPANGSLEVTDISPLYSLFHLEITAAEHTNGLRGIAPRHDVFLGLVDATRIDGENLDPFPASPPRAPGLVPLFDPDDRSRTPEMWSSPAAGDLVLLAGYPQDATTFPKGAVSVARVLSDDEASAAITRLASLGDEEGSIPYDPEVEYLLEGDAEPGMSGGGAFDHDGRWIGTLVRASDLHDGTRIIRIVRATYLSERVSTAFAALPPARRATLVPFLDPALIP
jgi:hypothetical protein